MTTRAAIVEPQGFGDLLRTPGGLPIPHVAAWSSELTDRVGPDPHCAMLGDSSPAIFSAGAQGVGRAVLGEMEPERQRRAMIMRRCQVCDTALEEPVALTGPPTRPLWLADLRFSGGDLAGDVGSDARGQTIRVGGRTVPLIAEPWVCEPCLAYALQVCPGMLGAHKRSTPLRLLRVRNAAPVAARALISGDGPVAGRVAISYVKLAVIDADVIAPDDFLSEHL